MKVSPVEAIRRMVNVQGLTLSLAAASPRLKGTRFPAGMARPAAAMALIVVTLGLPRAMYGAARTSTGLEGDAKPRAGATVAESFQEDAAAVVFEHLTDSNGLVNPVVSSFAEDGDGFLWVGSQSGLQRWDGYRFWTYTMKTGDATTLPDNLVNTLYTDTRGQVWVGTSSGGLALYDRANDRFIRYQTDANHAGRVNVRSITGDGGHGLWIVADNGLHHFDPNAGAFTRADLAAIDGRHPQATVTLRSADGAIWAGTDAGLQWVPADAWTGKSYGKFERFPLPSTAGASVEVSSLFEDKAGRVWVGTRNGVYVVETAGQNGSIRSRSARFPRCNGPIGNLLASKQILAIAESSQGEMWFATQDEGVLALNPKTGETRQIEHNPAMPESLSNNWVTALHPGRGSVMWVGTEKNISYMDTSAKGAFTLFGGAGGDQPFTDTDVYSILSRRDGSIWLGLKANGINLLDAAGHKTGELRPRAGISSKDLPEHELPLGTLPCLVEAGDDTVYICTQRALYRTEPVARGEKSAVPRILRVPIGDEAGVGLATVLPDRVGTKSVLWIAGSNGLWQMDQGDTIGPARAARVQQPLTDPRLTTLLRGAGDSLWIGTENGLNRLDVTTNAVERILPDPGDPGALGAGLISTLLMDRMGRLWVGTFSGGIDVLEGQDASGRPRFRRIVDGLPNENVDTLLNAPDGSIWASTDGGLARIDPVTYSVTVLRRAEGSLLAAYWNNVGAVTPSGEMFFGGTGGMTVVRPSLAKPWTYQPPVVVTHAHIGNFDVPPSRFNSGPDEPPVWIAPEYNDLTVEFAALDYTAPERNRYEYKLQGFDKVWIAADSTRRVARYTNLPPGDYTLLLRGSNRDGLWAPPRQVRVHVIPAWHQTWWFSVLVVLVSVLVLFGLFLLATAYLRRQQRELEREVARRTAELHRMTVELKDSQRKLEHMAYSDSLTDLPNRRMFTEHFRHLLAMKLRQRGGFALLLIDFDRFKEINDTFGHDAGDAVLKEMSQRMAVNVRAADCFARLGGDEFGLLLADAPGSDGMDTVCQKIVESFEEPVEFGGLKLTTSPSIGVSFFPEDGETQDELYKAADMALYQAKRQGGNGACVQRAELKLL